MLVGWGWTAETQEEVWASSGNLKGTVNKIPALSSCKTTKLFQYTLRKTKYVELPLKHYTCAPQCERCETTALGCESDKMCSGYNEVCCKEVHREDTTTTTITSETPSDWASSPPINSAVREAVLGGDNVSWKRNIFDICLLLCSLADLGK